MSRAPGLLEEMIDAAVLGDKTSPWDIDPKHPPVGNFQDRFNAGDQQILLWEIHFSAREGKPVPVWGGKGPGRHHVRGRYRQV